MNQEAILSLADALDAAAPLPKPVRIKHAVTGYDGAFLALAKRQGVKLVTEDKKLRRAAPALACSLEDYLSGFE